MSPFVSQAQKRHLYAKHPKIAREFAAHTPEGTILPERVKQKKKAAIPKVVRKYKAKIQKYKKHATHGSTKK